MPLAAASIALRQKCDCLATACFYAMGFRELSLTSEFVGLYPQIHCSLRRGTLKSVNFNVAEYLYQQVDATCAEQAD